MWEEMFLKHAILIIFILLINIIVTAAPVKPQIRIVFLQEQENERPGSVGLCFVLCLDSHFTSS